MVKHVVESGVRTHEFELAEQYAMWGPVYESIISLLGPTGVIIPIGDAEHENVGRTNVTILGGESILFTYSEAVSGFDIVPSSEGPYSIPIITFNGSDEDMSAPDSEFWTRDDPSGHNEFSIGIWVYIGGAGTNRVLLSKWDETTGSQKREWRFTITPANVLKLELYDENSNVSSTRLGTPTVTTGSFRFLVSTYDGTKGNKASDGVVFYENGVVVSSVANNDASYNRMRDQDTLPRLGSETGTAGSVTNYLNGKVVGGCLGPFYNHEFLVLSEVQRLYQLGRSSLGI